MAAPDPEDLDADKIASEAQLASMTDVDGRKVQNRSVSEMIAADRYRRSQQAAANKGTGIRFLKISPPPAD